MPTNKGFAMIIKSNNGSLVPLYPNTIVEQIIDWNIGQVYGPYTINLSVSGWVENQQIITLDGISEENIPICVKILTGNQSEMIMQNEAYNLLDPIIGVESLQNEVRFTCTSTPTVDFQVQVSWTV